MKQTTRSARDMISERFFTMYRDAPGSYEEIGGMLMGEATGKFVILSLVLRQTWPLSITTSSSLRGSVRQQHLHVFGGRARDNRSDCDYATRGQYFEEGEDRLKLV